MRAPRRRCNDPVGVEPPAAGPVTLETRELVSFGQDPVAYALVGGAEVGSGRVGRRPDQAGHTRLLSHAFPFRFLLARVVVNNGLAIDYRILTEDGMGDIIGFAFVA